MLSTVADSATKSLPLRRAARRAARRRRRLALLDGVAVEVVRDHRRAARHAQKALLVVVEHVALGPAQLEHLFAARRRLVGLVAFVGRRVRALRVLLGEGDLEALVGQEHVDDDARRGAVEEALDVGVARVVRGLGRLLLRGRLLALVVRCRGPPRAPPRRSRRPRRRAERARAARPRVTPLPPRMRAPPPPASGGGGTARTSAAATVLKTLGVSVHSTS